MLFRIKLVFSIRDSNKSLECILKVDMCFDSSKVLLRSMNISWQLVTFVGETMKYFCDRAMTSRAVVGTYKARALQRHVT
jgi:hypothetical protein